MFSFISHKLSTKIFLKINAKLSNLDMDGILPIRCYCRFAVMGAKSSHHKRNILMKNFICMLDIFLDAFWWREAGNQARRSELALGEGRRGSSGGWGFILSEGWAHCALWECIPGTLQWLSTASLQHLLFL